MKHLILFLAIITATACGKKDIVSPPPVTDPVARINQWILDSMKRYYYWGDGIAAKPVIEDPNSFFKSILSVNDRFSWISNGRDLLPPSNSYFTYGFHYALVEAAGYPGLIGVVTAVNKGGAADLAGFARGSYFIAVGGVKMTTGNMAAVNLSLSMSSSVHITPATYDGTNWTPGAELILFPGYRAENPAQTVRTFEAGGVRTGYLYYSSFDEHYDAELLAAINKLRGAGISELILDLRYNAGGSVATSGKLAALVAGKLTGNEIYAIYAGNRAEGKKGRSLQEVLNTSGAAAGKQYENLRPMQLSLNRIFVLTTGGTVSAAELIVNNLKPFLPLIQIGEPTRGKNEAGFLITDQRIPPQVAWSLEPTVYKLFNKNNEGNYENGLIPQYPVAELAALPLTAMGSSADPLVKKALEIIYGNNIPQDYNILQRGRRLTKVKPLYRSSEDATTNSLMRVR